MKYSALFFLFCLLFSTILLQAYPGHAIIDFEQHNYEVSSYPEEDEAPDSWEINSEDSAPGSNRSLHLFGNTWKQFEIEEYQLQSKEVWSLKMKSNSLAEIQGIGLSDGENTIFYSIFGSQMMDIETWIPAYQGFFPANEWIEVFLPVTDDWLAWFEYMPTINSLIFVNDKDNGSARSCRFDDIYSVNKYIENAPQVSISYTTNGLQGNMRSFSVSFQPVIFDEDSALFTYEWMFGDGETSTEKSPTHYYDITGSEEFSVLLKVTDESGKFGLGSCRLNPEPGESDLPVTMSFVGDIMLARRYEEGGGIIPTNGVNSIFQHVRPNFIFNNDYTVANLECPLTNATTGHPTKSVVFKGSPENVSGLYFAGIDHVTLANNHTTDYLEEGMIETMQVLDEQGISYTGAGMSSNQAYLPSIANVKGVNYAFVASSDRTGQYNNAQPYLQAGYNKYGFAYMTPYYVQKQIEAVQDVVDLVVVETHCGSEYSNAPGAFYDYNQVWNGWQEEDFAEEEDYTPKVDIPHLWDLDYRHYFVDAGADLVICHHPHIIQGLEYYNGTLIAHSLGNFVFDLNYPETMPTMILKTYSNNSGFYRYEVIPAFIDDYIPRPVYGDYANHLLDYLAFRSKEQNTYLSVDRDNGIAWVETDTLNLQPAEAVYNIDFELENQGGTRISQPLPLDKVGNISELSMLTMGNYEYRVGRDMVWFGNFTDEGCTLWDLNSGDEEMISQAGMNDTDGLVHHNSNTSSSISTWFEGRSKRLDALEYSVYGWISGQDVQSSNIKAHFYSNRTSGSAGEIATTPTKSGTFDWEFVYEDFSIDSYLKYFQIQLESDGENGDESETRFDNVGLIAWEDWQPVTSELISNPNDYYFIQIRTSDAILEASVQITELDYSGNYIPTMEREDTPGTPNSGKITSIYPNPFGLNSSRESGTTIKFNTSNSGKVKLDVYNVKGQHITTLLNDSIAKGNHEIQWNGTCKEGKRVGSGIYLLQLKMEEKVYDSRKCMILK